MRSDMKSIKEMSEVYLEEKKDELVCVYDRYAGLVDGANYVLEEIGKLINYKRWSEQDLYKVIDELKK